jgi:hypothetical protein
MTRNWTAGMAAFAVASPSVPSVMQMASPQSWSSSSFPVLAPQNVPSSPGSRGDELEVGASRSSGLGPLLVAVIHHAVRIEGNALEGEAAERPPADHVGRARPSTRHAGVVIEDDVRGLEGVDDLDHLAAGAVLLAHDDRAPGRPPNGIAVDRAAEDGLHFAVGESDPLNARLRGVVGLVAGDEVGGVAAVRPEGDHVEVLARVRRSRHHPHPQALGHGGERAGVGLRGGGVHALVRRLLQGLVHPEQEPGRQPELLVSPHPEVEPSS